ncbi:FAD binding domain-containing protein [Gordonia amicalis]|uniref:FAD binding domain-containing protein n=1 Tax=Gordonia amicalis TaxID=89053 RepID=A0AAE4U9I7_9ACTN|nr:FAD binding domain-containing protein [Gordonia amicalis]MBA5846387.1 FAD binding domain-containing protein [Gordonia amicalis]MDJ0452780.1 FAD binding domain-containing protein [Gordonia amicalis]MDV6310832.1 FAD binding domain-containing protein [Gordonia amicalis]MDV7075384.1 FAD binding domain-containing protein [Gordonia amicalis]NKX76529.1 FAD-binding molybdopterin dehydrogenase [Gordonia amicalis]
MDLTAVTQYRFARSRGDVFAGPGEQLVAGGTWVFSEPQPATTGLIDLSEMGWESVEDLPDGGLRIGATCTIAELVALPPRPGFRAHPLFAQCANALLASFKIWNMATVGGNICRSFAAASMVSLAVALDATALIWNPDGADRCVPVAELVIGNGINLLGPGEVLRAIDFPAHALAAVTGFRKIALADLGRSGAVVTGRIDPDATTVFGITAATEWPTVLRYPRPPTADRLHHDITTAPGYYTDPLGSADWRRGVSAALAEEIRLELTGTG